MKSPRLYLDHAATTPPDPLVMEELSRVASEFPGNPSSLHSDGIRAREVVESSRAVLAASMQCEPGEICFTSGGTEANNLALKGFALANNRSGNHILVSSIEHDCILESCRWLERVGFRVTRLPVGEDGIVDPEAVRKAIVPDTILVSVMHVNNETGAIQPLAEIGRIAAEHGIAFHTDACQSFGKMAFHPRELNISLASVNGHKIYGPKGVGALYVRKGTLLEPLLHGGGQEHGLRSTTENVAGMAGFAMAARLCGEWQETDERHLSILRERLVTRLFRDYPNVMVNSPVSSFPGILNFTFTGMEGEGMRLLMMLDDAGFAVSAGSACSSNHQAGSGSHVLRAMGRNPVEARGAIRVSPGRGTREADIDRFCDTLWSIIPKLKPVYSF